MKHVKFKEHYPPYNSGEHAGFADHAVADRYVKSGAADYCDKDGRVPTPPKSDAKQDSRQSDGK